jgi:hypothetical protein
MNTVNAAAHLDRAAHSSQPSRNLRQWWSVISALILIVIFTQAVFAGLMLSGVDWGRTAHKVTSVVLIASTLVAGLVAVVSLRRIPHGMPFGLTLLSLEAALVLQTALGASSAHGANLLWLHVPLGVALVGFAAQAVAGARRLGGE